MCGRYSLFVQRDDLEERFGAQFVDGFEPRYNAAPGQELPVVRGDDRGAFRAAQWGLIPSWADEDFSGLINARSETVAEKPAFRSAYASRRCLVPADGFYEWRQEAGGKQPYRITVGDGEPFAMAGLWETWTPRTQQTGLGDFAGDASATAEEPSPVVTFTVLTREPNAFMGEYHDRQPVVLARDEEAAWLDGADVAAVEGPGADAFDAYAVSTAVNSPANDSPAVVEPL